MNTLFSKTLFMYPFLITLLISFFPAETFGQAISGYSVSVNQNNHKTKFKLKNALHSFDIEYEGEIQLADDDKDIISISKGGFIEIKKSAFGSRRRILIEADRNGNLVKQYYIGRREQNFNPEGQEWLAEILPEVVRSSALGAASRVDRFYNKNGVKGVLDEVRLLNSDYVKSLYLKLLLEKNIQPSDVPQIIDIAGREIDSDHYLSSLLNKNQALFLANETSANSYIKAIDRIDSDHYKTQVLKKAIRNREVADSQVNALLRAAEDIDSDHYLSNVLSEIMDERTLDQANLEKVINLSRFINSDHYKTEVLKDALKIKDLSAEAKNAMLATLKNMNSDHYINVVTSAMLKNELDEPTLTSLLNLLSSSMNSDHYITETMKKVITKQSLEAKSFKAFSGLLKKVNSDHYTKVVLSKLAYNYNHHSSINIIDILDLCRTINSDNYLASTLIAWAPIVNKAGENTKTKYREIAKNINSDTYYGKAMKALN